MSTRRVVLLTNRSLLAAGVQRLLEERDDLQLSLVATDDRQWPARVRQESPQVIVLDSGDSSLGEGVIGLLLQEHPKARVVALNLNPASIEVYRVRRVLRTNVEGLLDAVRGRQRQKGGMAGKRQGGGAMDT